MPARMSIPLCWLILASFGVSMPAEAKLAPDKSALATDPKGWVDLLQGGLKDWQRIPLPAGEKLSPKNPWKVDAKTQTLLCSEPGIFEMLLHPKQFGDGIYHVEWRFHKVKDKDNYNSGIYVRCSADGKVWHQAQVAQNKKPPQYGDLFGMTLVAGKTEQFLVPGKGNQLAKPPGEWNTYEITCKGKAISVWMNGETATTWTACQVPQGYLGVQAEFFVIEFKNMKFKPAK